MEDRILFIDDDQNLLSSLQRQFQKDFTISIARGGDEALASIYHADSQQSPFAVVVCDMGMPGMNGVEVLQRIKDISPDIVRIMLTGKGDQKTAIDAINTGNVFRFYSKPCPPAELATGLREALVQYHAAKNERELLERLGYPRAKDTSLPLSPGLLSAKPEDSGTDGFHPAKVAVDLVEEERLKRMAAAAEARKDIQDLVGYDIVNHDRLITLADNIWREVPPKKRASYTTQDWQAAIYEKCRDSLVKAEKKLAESNPEPRLLKANVNILRSAFARQVIRAMREISLHYSEYQAKTKGL